MAVAVARAPAPASETAAAWKYLAMAYAFAWIPWIACVKLHASEMMFYIGGAGPAIAALILLQSRPTAVPRFCSARIVLFILAAAGCSVILSEYYAARSGSTLHFQWNPWSLIPSIAPAWILSSVFSADGQIRDLARSLVRLSRWSLIALIIFPGIVVVGDVVARCLHQPLVRPGLRGSAAACVATAAIYFVQNLLFVAVLEEPGWRGFLLPLLQQKKAPLHATLIVWLAWALWHAPLDLSRPVPFSLVQYLEIRVVFLIPVAVILTWLYNRSSRSVQSCAVFHAGMNTFPFVLPYWMPSFGLLFAIAGVALVTDRMWRKSQC